jgi:hypothetical protein
MKCPTCFSKLKSGREAPLEMMDPQFGAQNGVPRYPDELVYWCPKCKMLIFEEDFLFTTQE